MTKVMPVIHWVDDETAMLNAKIAYEANCHGVFLIDMSGHMVTVDNAAVAIKSEFPSLIVGANRFNMLPHEAIEHDMELGLDATWSDNSWIRSDIQIKPNGFVDKTVRALASRDDFYYFAGIAFKYQKEDPDPAAAAMIACDLGFIATTSGSGTGSAPTVEKIKTIKDAIGTDWQLAVASGITPENAKLFVPHSDYFLVSTGISKSFYEFDPESVAELVRETS